MSTAKCPSCGSAVHFLSATSLLAVCGHCRATLLRKDLDLEKIGEMAAILETTSRVQLGSEGEYEGQRFVVIGRVQMQFPQGIWNEWHIQMADMRSGWMSEGSGEWYITFPIPTNAALPAFETLRAGQKVRIGTDSYTIVNLEQARCVAGEGELPFKIGSGIDAPVADLRVDDKFATIDYSDTTPMLFMGKAVEWDTLKLKNLREDRPWDGLSSVAAKEFKCPGCGAPHKTSNKAIASVVCEFCGTVSDTSRDEVAAISKFNAKQHPRMLIPMGQAGQLQGKSWKCVGFVEKTAVYDGEEDSWYEYLLYDNKGEYRWLTEYNGHWNIVQPARSQPTVSADGQTARFMGKTFTLHESSEAKTTYATGEFYWQIKAGETVQVRDYVHPPEVISYEATENDITWSAGRSISADKIRNGFKLEQPLPESVGVGAAEEAESGSLWGLYFKFLVGAFVIQTIFGEGWGPFWFSLITLMIMPAIVAWRKNSHEADRFKDTGQ